MAQMDALTFEAVEEVFDNDVVERIAFTGHTLTDTKIFQPLAVSMGNVLDATVGVKNESGHWLVA